MAKYEIVNGVGIIPDGETTIMKEAFKGCKELTSVVIPSSVTDIGFYAFQYCSNLESITIPKSVVSIPSNAFAGCHNLKHIVVEDGNPNYDSRDNCNAIIRGDTLMRGCVNTIIPNGVKAIGWGAFSGVDLTEIVIPEGVEKIDNEAFCYCENLKSISIPKSVIEIRTQLTFHGCVSLSSIVVEEGNPVYDSMNNCIIENGKTLILGCCNSVIPEGVEIVGARAFSHCTGLTKIVLPESLKAIKGYAFANCTMLSEVVIPENVEEIEDHAFRNSGLTSITVPAKVKDLSGIFWGCKNLKSAIVCGKLEEYRSCNVFPFMECSSLESITFLDCVRYIKDESCTGCKSLKHIYVPAKKGDYYKKRFVEELHPLIVEMEPVKKSKKKA